MPDGNNCKCKGKHKIERKGLLTFLPGLLIAILPKCPFCLLTYSSAITLCSGRTIYDHQPGWASWIAIGLVVVTAAAVLFNYKGRRTLLALSLVLTGGSLIIFSELISGATTPYFIGAAILLFGCWLNGSFLHFYRKLLAFNKKLQNQPLS